MPTFEFLKKEKLKKGNKDYDDKSFRAWRNNFSSSLEDAAHLYLNHKATMDYYKSKFPKNIYSLDEYKIYISFIASFSVFLVAQLNDITYYDGKISIIFSVLLACLKNIIEEKNNLKKI